MMNAFQFILSQDQTSWRPVRGASGSTDGFIADAGTPMSPAAAFGYAYSGRVSGSDVWNRVRGARVFKIVNATASGNTTVWTPNSGTRFRILALFVSVSGTIASTGTLTIQLTEGNGGTVLWRGLATVSSTITGDTQLGTDYGLIGQPAAATDTNLVVNLSTAMTAGAVAINVWGTEEVDAVT